jgi:signal transduction histidine kinase
MAKPVPPPPPGFDELSVDEKINYLQWLHDRIVDSTDKAIATKNLDGLRKLIAAHEEERARIAGALHDDIGQRLAVVAIDLDSLAHGSPGAPEFSSLAAELQRKVSEIARDVQALSHELHSSKLALLGIAGSVRQFCDEFSTQQKLRIDVEANDLTRQLPSAVSLTLFRILQEALHNSVKHGEARHCRVRLWEADGSIHLMVGDDGAGFDVAAARSGYGIGLISMEERIKLVDGVLSITSQPQHGTDIHARVPLAPDEADLSAFSDQGLPR